VREEDRRILRRHNTCCWISVSGPKALRWREEWGGVCNGHAIHTQECQAMVTQHLNVELRT
jgi:hypothetical protein